MLNSRLAAALLFAVCVTASAQTQSLFLNALPEYVVVPNAAALNPTIGLTVEAWVRFDAGGLTQPYSPTIVRKNPTDFAESYILRRVNGLLSFGVRTNSSSAGVFQGLIPDGVWRHVAGTYDGGFVRTYIDGAFVNQTPLTGQIAATMGELRIGAGNALLDENFLGQIDELRIWSIARSQSEITSGMYLALTSATGLVGSWRFEGNLLDSAGGNDGVSGTGTPSYMLSGVNLEGWVEMPALAGFGAPLGVILHGAEPFFPYIFEVSVDGTSPGQAIGDGRYFPLNAPNLNLEYGAYYPGVFNNFFGFLNGQGKAYPTLSLPAEPGLVGYSFSAAFVTLDALASQGIKSISLPATTLVAAAAPVITTIQPAYGTIAGTTTVTINGGNFSPGANVYFGSVPAANVNQFGSAQLTCTAPSMSAGPSNVTVTNSGGVSTTSVGAFTYVPPLLITGITPPASATANQTITITGAGFVPGMLLSVAGQSIAPMTISPTMITYPNPAGIGCGVVVSLSSPTGESAQRIFNAIPTLTMISPSSVPSAGGANVFLVGANHPGCSVTVDGVPATIVLQSSAVTRILAPPHAPGPAQVVLSSPAGCSVSGTLIYF